MRSIAGTIGHAELIQAVEQASAGIAIADAAGNIRYVNPAFTTLTGYSSEEALGKNPRVLKSGHHSETFYRELWDTIRSGRVWHGELINRRKDGTTYCEEMRIAPVTGSDGAITSYIAVKDDVTAQRAQQSAQALLASIVDSSEDAISSSTLDGTILTWNRGAEALLGYAREEIVGRSLSLIVLPERRERLLQILETVSKGRSIPPFDAVLRGKDERRIEVSFSIFPVRNSAGEVVGASGIARDISRRLQTERKLAESEERFRGVFESAPVGMYLAGRDGKILQVNAAYCQMMGYSEEELLAKKWPEFCHPDELAAALQWKEQFWENPTGLSSGKGRVIHRDGRVIWCSLRVSPLRTADGNRFCDVIHAEDITERKLRSEALRESEERFRNMADCSPSFMWVTGADGQVEFVNRTLREFCGINSEEAGRQIWQLLIHPDDAPAWHSAFLRAVSEHTRFSAEARVRRADGE